MNHVEVCIEISNLPDSLPEIILAHLSEIGYDSFVEETSALKAYIPENKYSKKETDIVLQAYFVEYSAKIIEAKNWNAEWEKNFQPILIADKLFVRADFHEKNPKAQMEIIINPKMAFGTGHHQTTSQMCELILKHKHEKKKVLDMGCGTGILSILAAKLGAESVVAIDIDEWAYENTIENAEINNVENIETIIGGAENIPNQKFDIIYANINLNVLKNDIPNYKKALKKNALLFLSGFYDTDLEQILNVCTENGLNLKEQSMEKKWMACVFKN
ncbi:MAG: 50S ribosomal protein L11 methyltransferase [Bacteroidales bacterium]|nr:50S ribosomal protein L11 methyltransferase [Bacteroidales bacterium]